MKGTSKDLLSNASGMPIYGSTPYIEHQERQGQSEIVGQTGNAIQLPVQGSGNPLLNKWIRFGDVVSVDPIFRTAILPEGWRLERTDHHLWSNVIDDKGRKRAEVFYKAAFYDRSSFMRPTQRYQVQIDYEVANKTGDLVACVTDANTEIFRTNIHPTVKYRGEGYHAAMEALEAEAKVWLEANHPDAYNKETYGWES